jgi:hypothetical protein
LVLLSTCKYQDTLNTYSKPASPGIDPSRILGQGTKGSALLILPCGFSAFMAVVLLVEIFVPTTFLLVGATNAAVDAIIELKITQVFMIKMLI